MNKKIYIVSADHISPKFQAIRKGVDVHEDPVGPRRKTPGYFADASPYGCGKTYATPEKAIYGLLYENGCTNIRIEG